MFKCWSKPSTLTWELHQTVGLGSDAAIKSRHPRQRELNVPDAFFILFSVNRNRENKTPKRRLHSPLGWLNTLQASCPNLRANVFLGGCVLVSTRPRNEWSQGEFTLTRLSRDPVSICRRLLHKQNTNIGMEHVFLEGLAKPCILEAIRKLFGPRSVDWGLFTHWWPADTLLATGLDLARCRRFVLCLESFVCGSKCQVLACAGPTRTCRLAGLELNMMLSLMLTVLACGIPLALAQTDTDFSANSANNGLTRPTEVQADRRVWTSGVVSSGDSQRW
ncbi:hypothetical protein RRG08_039969 [Elysia crispata]|uniref:Uncharacterized protein n=1 Tax=Elysia crispata TaxID=231223 RepID=A0AAE0Z7U7_9GAST|nr:hypothetical protein RRG08_039969 [Elysia crispata]